MTAKKILQILSLAAPNRDVDLESTVAGKPPVGKWEKEMAPGLEGVRASLKLT
jgi:hypothetical protein